MPGTILPEGHFLKRRFVGHDGERSIEFESTEKLAVTVSDHSVTAQHGVLSNRKPSVGNDPAF